MNKKITALLLAFWVGSMFITGASYFKLNSKIKNLEEDCKYLELTLKTLAIVNKIPDTSSPSRVNNNNRKSGLIFDNSNELEKRIQTLEAENREQQQKIKDNEFKAADIENKMWLDNYEREYKSKRGY